MHSKSNLLTCEGFPMRKWISFWRRAKKRFRIHPNWAVCDRGDVSRDAERRRANHDGIESRRRSARRRDSDEVYHGNSRRMEMWEDAVVPHVSGEHAATVRNGGGYAKVAYIDTSTFRSERILEIAERYAWTARRFWKNIMIARTFTHEQMEDALLAIAGKWPRNRSNSSSSIR